MILVTGATGNVGSQLVAKLVARGEPVRAVVRDPATAGLSGVEIVQADLESPESLTPALDGTRNAFLLGGWSNMPEILRRMQRASVERVVLLTSRCVVGGHPDNPVTRMWLDAEAAVRDSGIPWTVLRPSGYQSNALRWLPQLQAGEVVRAPWPDVATAAIDPADIASVAATVLTEPGHEGAAYTLSGPKALTPADQIATLAHVLGRPLRYQPISDEEARREMAETTPAAYIDAFFRFYSEGEFDDSSVIDTVSRITGCHPRTFEQWARAHASAFARRDTVV
jgi:uncharacterized protein YbjT (DUF2867 family)